MSTSLVYKMISKPSLEQATAAALSSGEQWLRGDQKDISKHSRILHSFCPLFRTIS